MRSGCLAPRERRGKLLTQSYPDLVKAVPKIVLWEEEATLSKYLYPQDTFSPTVHPHKLKYQKAAIYVINKASGLNAVALGL